MKPVLAVLVGAGGSIELGVPGTSALLAIAEQALRERPTFVSEECPLPLTEVVDRLLKRCREYYGDGYNFEHLLHVLEALDTMGGAFRSTIPSTGKAVEAMLASGPHEDIVCALDRYFALSGRRALISSLHSTITEASAAAPASGRWTNFAGFWQQLASSFDLSIATLNYDSLLERALGVRGDEQGFKQIPGENAWRLDERLLRQQPRLMHLHGSVHFGYREYETEVNRFSHEDSWDDLYWHADPVAARNSLGARSTEPTQGRRRSMKGPLIVGLDKPDKLLIEPYAAYLRAFADRLLECNRLLVVGYGFGDLHVNAIVRRMGKLHGATRRIAIIGKFDPVQMHGAWAARDVEARMIRMWSEDDDVINQFEYNNPLDARTGFLRIYYEGLLDVAANHLPSLVDFLRG